MEKLALRAPEVFADYYANDLIATACRAWLGPGYQVTSQVNVVNPGGAAQEPHRDYHLGFATDIQAARFPAHVHRLPPVLTLQGAVAHTDMPTETGPTLYLPHSQKYLPGSRRCWPWPAAERRWQRSGTSSRRARRATRSRPTWTWTSPPTGWRRPPKRTSSAGP
jgi:ectoine hydroxylase-related dioxygenase (phytanoyl-CoA dioxygenase family)